MWFFWQKLSKTKGYTYGLMLLAFGLFVAVNYSYFLFSFQILLGLLVLPFILKPQENNKGKLRYFWLTLFFFVLAMCFQLKVLLFMAWCCLLVFFIEFYIGAVGWIPLFFVGSISPALYYVVQIFSFPIRLLLSEWASQALNWAGYLVTNKGSYFVLPNGESFHIDQACVGLKMFGTGFIAANLILAINEKGKQGRFAFTTLVIAFFVMSALLVLCNFIRIIALVLFHSLPDTASHELIGIFALGVYVLLPFVFLGSKLRVKPMPKTEILKPNFGLNPYLPVLGLLLLGFGSSLFAEYRKQQRTDADLEVLQLPGFSKKAMEDGVMQFKTDSLLIYIKPALRAFEGGHPPQICWQANGFNLIHFEERKLGSNSFMLGVLQKDGLQQYTAWWYDNGTTKTIHEWEWRTRSAEPFRVFNICAKDTLTLNRAIHSYMEKPLWQTK